METSRNRKAWLMLVTMAFCLSMPDFGEAKDKAFVNSIGMEFVLIPAGTFTMGSPDEETGRDAGEVQHQVTLTQSFYMQTTEVTLGQWRQVMGKSWWNFFSRRKGPDDLPVSRVCYIDAIDFIQKLNALGEGQYRLPTEAEWEYARRAGTKTAYSWGDWIDCSKAMFANKRGKFERCISYAEINDLPIDGPSPVKSYAPNPWGLYDMHGNLWELCHDWFGAYESSAAVDPKGPSEGMYRVRRGGSWFGDGYKCRSANRAYGHPSSRLRNTGFRVVRIIQP